MSEYISEALLEEYVVDLCYLSMAGIIRSAYTESTACGDRIMNQLAKVLRQQSPRLRAPWQDFVSVTVPRLRDFLDEGAQVRARLNVDEAQRKLNAAKKRKRK